MENPLQVDVDIGKNSYNMPRVRRSFELAYQVLVSVLHGPDVQANANSILCYIINPDDALFRERPSLALVKQSNRTTGKKRK